MTGQAITQIRDAFLGVLVRHACRVVRMALRACVVRQRAVVAGRAFTIGVAMPHREAVRKVVVRRFPGTGRMAGFAVGAEQSSVILGVAVARNAGRRCTCVLSVRMAGCAGNIQVRAIQWERG